MENINVPVWKWLESTFPPPRFLRRVVRHPFSVFQSKILSNDAAFLRRIAESLYAGDFLILTKSAMPEALWDLKRKTFEWGKKNPEGQLLKENCKNTHFSGSGKCAEHSYYFFRWNKDELGVFSLLDRLWVLSKQLSGKQTDPDLVDRAQVSYFSIGSSKSKNSCDLFLHQKVSFGFPLSLPGKDFEKGGGYAMVTPTEKHNFERYFEPGDAFMHFPTLPIGVDTVQSNTKNEKPTGSGRWILSGQTVEPHQLGPISDTAGIPLSEMI